MGQQHAFVDKLFICFVLTSIASRVNCFCPRQFEVQHVKEEAQHSEETETDAASNGDSKPLNNIAVKVQSHPGPDESPNWNYLMTDLNEGNPESFVYVGMQFGYSNPISDVKIEWCDDADKLSSRGWECSPSNLNEDTSGICMNLCWKRADNEMKPIKNLFFLTTADSEPPKIPGWKQFGPNINYRTRSNTYVWAFYSRIVPFEIQNVMTNHVIDGESMTSAKQEESVGGTA